MTSVVRFTEIKGSDALLTTASADEGDEFSSQRVRRTFTAADVGTGAGQTRDATDPTLGCLIAQFRGSRIRNISGLQLWRQASPATTDINFVVTGTGANTVSIGLYVEYNPQTGISSIRLLDTAAANPGQIVAEDWIEFEVSLGDSETVVPW